MNLKYRKTNIMQIQVAEFMKQMDQHQQVEPSLIPADVSLLRYRLIQEESGELCRAMMHNDMVEIIDGLCDLLYVTFGAAEAYGIDIQMYFNEVHRSNMNKDPANRDSFGKVTKPPLWERPRIAEMLAEEIAFINLEKHDLDILHQKKEKDA
jgi:predicted HAD superfamily Cof-like phosphohydrolase